MKQNKTPAGDDRRITGERAVRCPEAEWWPNNIYLCASAFISAPAEAEYGLSAAPWKHLSAFWPEEKVCNDTLYNVHGGALMVISVVACRWKVWKGKKNL